MFCLVSAGVAAGQFCTMGQKLRALKRMAFGRFSRREKPGGDEKTVDIRFRLPILGFGRDDTSSPSGIYMWLWPIVKENYDSSPVKKQRQRRCLVDYSTVISLIDVSTRFVFGEGENSWGGRGGLLTTQPEECKNCHTGVPAYLVAEHSERTK
jgi:hypothetical protein